MFALIQQLVENLAHWEKVSAFLIGSGTVLFGLSKIVKFVYYRIKEANKSVKDFLLLIPDLEKMTKEFKPRENQSLFEILQRLENNLGHTDQKIRVIASCMGIAAFEADKNGLYTFVSKQWCEMTGLSYTEAIGNGWINIIDEDLRSDVFHEWEFCMKQNREFRFTSKLSVYDNKEVSIFAWPIRNLDGTVEKFFGILI